MELKLTLFPVTGWLITDMAVWVFIGMYLRATCFVFCDVLFYLFLNLREIPSLWGSDGDLVNGLI